MATAGGKVIVADTDRNQLKMFDDKGLLLKTITGKENDYDAPMHPDGIMCDSQNRIIVADNHNHNMRIPRPVGHFCHKVQRGWERRRIRQYKSDQGDGPGQYNRGVL